LNQAIGQPLDLDASFKECIRITREQAKNFDYAFRLLPKERYRGICSLYAFARLADDYSDDEADPARAVEKAREWQSFLERALNGDPSGHAIFPALADTVERFSVNPAWLHELVEGTVMDASINRYQTWDETYLYCYRVASVVGMMAICVFGFKDDPADPRALKLAEHTGIAFQLTNICRDVREDAARGRIYLPLEDLARFGLTESQYLNCEDSPAFRDLIKFQLERAKTYYEAGVALEPLMLPGSSRTALRGLVRVYRGLLDKIERLECDVLSQRVSLTKFEKLTLAGLSLFG
jgi:phytoene synthase